MPQQEITLTQQELNLILTRRELLKRRKEAEPVKSKGLSRPAGFGDVDTSKCASNNPSNDQERNEKNQNLRQDPKYWDKGRSPRWDAHCDPEKVHKGRLTPGHPMYWFEENVFRKITNMEHQAEHKKIGSLLSMPVQTNSRDRVYHALCHLDVLWTEGRLPIAYKKRYEDYKKEQGIGHDNIHPSHKKEGRVYPLPKNKKEWDEDKYKDFDENEVFTGKKVVND